MKLRILAVPDCPNVAALRQRLAEVLTGRADVAVTTEVIGTPERAVAVGMTGSPTLLVDGIDPFAESGQSPSLSCRLYRDETGQLAGAPSVTQLRAAIDVPGAPTPAAASAVVAMAEQACRPPTENAVTSMAEGLRTWRTRTTPTDPAARAVHQAILRAFATTGTPPTDAALDQIAADNGAVVAPILAQLHDADVIRLNPAGAIAVAYPFSGVPTRHRVLLASGVEVAAMCAIDALGIPAMLDTDATITASDPVTHEPVTIIVHSGQYVWSPASAVVFYSAAAGTGPSADCCCNDLNTFTSPATAQTWMREHPSIPGELLDTTTAQRLGRHIFAALLDRETTTSPGSAPPVSADVKPGRQPRRSTQMTTDALQRNIAFFRAQLESWPLPDLLPCLARLLAAGEPVTLQQVATAGGWTPDEVQAALARHPRVDYAEDGRIAGFGLTLQPTPHSFTFDGHTVYGFCASDALEFAVLLDRPGRIESTCPATGRRIRVEVTPSDVLAVDPPEAVVSTVRPTQAVTDIRAYCDLGNFFSSPDAATDWLAHNPHGQITSVVEDFTITRQSIIEVGWVAP